MVPLPLTTHTTNSQGGAISPVLKNYKKFFALLIRLEGINTQSLYLLVITKI